MSIRLMTCSMVATSILAAPTVMADPYKNKHVHQRYRSGPEYDYARVVDVDPITRRVRVETPVEECWDETRTVRSRPHISDPQVGGRVLLGSIIGGVIGHQFGSGRGRDAATIAGAVIGAGVGRDAAARRYPGDVRDETVQRCDTRYESRYEERIEGYDVEYVYNGRHYNTRLAYDPGDRIRIRVDVQPDYAG